MKKNMEYILGFVLLAAVLVWGRFGLNDTMLFFRLAVGVGLGYTLTRSYFGFAGSVNRAYNTGSTKLMRVLMWMFLGSAILTAGLLYNQDATQYSLMVRPINLGVVLGGLMFGFGMAFSMCCASGVLTDTVTGMPRALVTLFFFGMGVFIGFPVQKSASWVTDTVVSTETFANGVFLPDLFKWDGMDGYLGAIIVTAIFAIIVVCISKWYEDKRKAEGTYTGVDTEILQDQVVREAATKEEGTFKLFSKETYERVFVKPWSLGVGATVITGIFMLLMMVTKNGWGASTPFGNWFGRLLVTFGMSAERLAEFSGQSVQAFTGPFFQTAMNVQNIGIILGTIIALLLAGNLTKTFKSGLSITFKEAGLYAIGGLLMGFGTRLSNGCNVGALYTPIANFSLSGWIFLIALVAGGIAGAKINKKLTSNN